MTLISTALAAPAVAAVSVVTLDLVKQWGRKERNAPRPGTFHAEVKGSRLSIYTDGATLYEDKIQAIDSAQHSILLSAYIWKADRIGQRFVDALNAAADRGVSVHIIYDGFANLVVPPSFYRQLAPSIQVFRVPAVLRKYWKGLVRYTGVTHSKILVVDDVVGFVGGYNIGSRYAQKWRDTHLREEGSAVWGLRQTVARLWNADRAPEEHIPWIPAPSWDSHVRVAANMPVELVYPIRGMYLAAIGRAGDRIWIATPYFIPDQQVFRALRNAAQRGVDVRVMVPNESNHVLADWVSRGFFGQMLDAGITILLYTSSMMHSKMATIDGEWSTIGTANIDRLSLSFNYESNVEVTDSGFAKEVENVFSADAKHCEPLTSPTWRKRHPMARVLEVALVPLRPLL